MEFPFYLPLGDWRVHPHPVFEGLAYLLGFRVYLMLRKRRGDVVSKRNRWFVIIAAICGSAFGSRLLFWLIDPRVTLEHWNNPGFIMGGKTIVGAIIGGLIAVELTKKAVGIRARTGDLFALPLCIGIAIGRIGCFLTGLEDDTYGVATSLPWGIDFGDGIARHPTQLYEILVVIGIATWVVLRGRAPHRRGDLFLGFLWGYLFWRLLVEFIKPDHAWLGLTSIQWACLLTCLVYARDVPRIFGRRGPVLAPVSSGGE
ncbi:MAG: prolipoprotein diacylglyceryl transferase [Planctomycetota bacterium]|nr:prolipoprotein diacylglyceryl transferase [Planctomycetota bacterium]